MTNGRLPLTNAICSLLTLPIFMWSVNVDSLLGSPSEFSLHADIFDVETDKLKVTSIISTPCCTNWLHINSSLTTYFVSFRLFSVLCDIDELKAICQSYHRRYLLLKNNKSHNSWISYWCRQAQPEIINRIWKLQELKQVICTFLDTQLWIFSIIN